MHLYTFIMAYLGGTYISQVESSDENNAMLTWIAELELEEIDGFTREDQQNIIESQFENEPPVLLQGLANVWFFLVETKGGFGHVNFVKTIK